MKPDSSSSVGSLVDAAARWLTARHVDEARTQCEWLAAALLGLTRTELSALPGGAVAGEAFTSSFRSGVLRLGAGEPVQYVIGEWDFRFVTLKTDRRALIPRPETEQLVQLLLDTREIRRVDAPLICDVGTGSGCVAISLATEFPSCRCIAVDCDESALQLARENAEACRVTDKISFVLGRNCAACAPASIDAVISNPPYIASEVCNSLERKIRDFEPRSALDGGADGLGVIRNIVNDCAIVIRPGGWCFLEIGDDQGEAVGNLLEDAGFSEISVLRDFSKKNRFVRGRIV